MNFKFQVSGQKDSYMQLKIVNSTSYANFACKAYRLISGQNGALVPDYSSEKTYFLKGRDDAEYFKVDARRGEWIGIAFPPGIDNITYAVSYRNTFIIDGIDVTLMDATSSTTNFDTNF